MNHFYVHPLYVISYRYIWRSKKGPVSHHPVLAATTVLVHLASGLKQLKEIYHSLIPLRHWHGQISLFIYPQSRGERTPPCCVPLTTVFLTVCPPKLESSIHFFGILSIRRRKYQRYGSRPIDELELYIVESPLYMEKRYLCELGVPNILLDALNYQKTNAAF